MINNFRFVKKSQICSDFTADFIRIHKNMLTLKILTDIMKIGMFYPK